MDEVLVRARASWPGVALSLEAFAAALERHRPPFLAAPAPDGGGWLDGLRGEELYLAAACAAGDEVAVRHLERLAFEGLEKTLARIDGSSAFVDEVKQELRLHLLVPARGGVPRLAQYAGRGSLVGWVHVAAARVALNLKRRSGPDALALGSFQGGVSSDAGAVAVDAETAYLRERYRDQLQVAFREAVGELTARQRNILRMHFLDGVPLERLALLYGLHRTTLGRWVTKSCEQVLARTRRHLSSKAQLPPKAMDSLILLLRSELDFSASLLRTDSLEK